MLASLGGCGGRAIVDDWGYVHLVVVGRVIHNSTGLPVNRIRVEFAAPSSTDCNGDFVLPVATAPTTTDFSGQYSAYLRLMGIGSEVHCLQVRVEGGVTQRPSTRFRSQWVAPDTVRVDVVAP